MIADGEDLSPERARRVLEDRARALARPPQQHVASERGLSVATFQLGAERFAIDASAVREVSRLREFTAIPGLPEFVVGVTNLRGEVLAVVDLGRFLGIGGVRSTEGAGLIVLGGDEAELAIAVDETQEVTSVDPDALHAPPAHLAATERALLRGVTADALVLLDGAALLADPRLFFDQNDEA